MKYSRLFISLLFLLCAGCAPVISEQSMQLVDRTLSFDTIKKNPDQYIGRYVLVGGKIASVSNSKQAGQLEIVQFRLDSDNMPVESHQSGGRFLAMHNGFLDPLIYKPGRLVTIVGEVKGQRTMPLDRIEYDYPVIAIREVHLWSPEYVRPYPYPYDPYYPEYWWRPYGMWRPWW